MPPKNLLPHLCVFTVLVHEKKFDDGDIARGAQQLPQHTLVTFREVFSRLIVDGPFYDHQIRVLREHVVLQAHRAVERIGSADACVYKTDLGIWKVAFKPLCNLLDVAVGWVLRLTASRRNGSSDCCDSHWLAPPRLFKYGSEAAGVTFADEASADNRVDGARAQGRSANCNGMEKTSEAGERLEERLETSFHG